MFLQLEARGLTGKQAAGAGGTTTYAALQKADAVWLDIRTRAQQGPRPTFVSESAQLLGRTELDVVVSGGTLGIFLAAALQAAGLRVAVVEAGALQGRSQDWNISRKELNELVEAGALSAEEVEAAITIKFNPVRAAFYGSPPLLTQDVLNLGVSPAALVASARARFEAAGGRVLEHSPLEGVTVHPDGVAVACGTGSSSASEGSSSVGRSGSGTSAARPQQLNAKLLVDAMGTASPIVRQVRWGTKPDGICCVVGSLASGPWSDNRTADLIATLGNSQPPAATIGGRPSNLQYFWEAFPAGSGPHDRTTYMFTYLDASSNRPSLEAMFEDYWRLMPDYQGVRLEDLEVQRILFGVFKTYRDSPLCLPFDRLLAVGDAAGYQSPLSFGGFGALTRHLRRLTNAVREALEADCTDRSSLALINAYNPGLSAAWMLQRAMSIPADASSYDEGFINSLLGQNFAAMAGLGEGVVKPFLQDVLQLRPLAATLVGQVLSSPGSVPSILRWVGPGAMADWLRHFLALAAYTMLNWGGQIMCHWTSDFKKLPPRQRYVAHRLLDAWEYGSGADYKP